jgi:hypothetical protein
MPVTERERETFDLKVMSSYQDMDLHTGMGVSMRVSMIVMMRVKLVIILMIVMIAMAVMAVI